MTIPFLKTKKLKVIGGATLAAIIILIVFLVLPVVAVGTTAEFSLGGATVGGGAGVRQGQYITPGS